MIPTLSFGGPWWTYAAWSAGAFVATFFLNSFIEWAAHRYVMHRPFKLIPYGYAHTTSHHAKFDGFDRYTLDGPGDDRRDNIVFTWREYVLFPVVCLAVYTPVEMLMGKPIMVGVLLATFSGLQLFNSMHLRFHAPSERSWLQGTRFFRFLREHHRLHHEDMTKNFNVYFFPIADWVFGTMWTGKSAAVGGSR